MKKYLLSLFCTSLLAPTNGTEWQVTLAQLPEVTVVHTVAHQAMVHHHQVDPLVVQATELNLPPALLVATAHQQVVMVALKDPRQAATAHQQADMVALRDPRPVATVDKHLSQVAMVARLQHQQQPPEAMEPLLLAAMAPHLPVATALQLLAATDPLLVVLLVLFQVATVLRLVMEDILALVLRRPAATVLHQEAIRALPWAGLEALLHQQWEAEVHPVGTPTRAWPVFIHHRRSCRDSVGSSTRCSIR